MELERLAGTYHSCVNQETQHQINIIVKVTKGLVPYPLSLHWTIVEWDTLSYYILLTKFREDISVLMGCIGTMCIR